jgi:hypothetical protein
MNVTLLVGNKKYGRFAAILNLFAAVDDVERFSMIMRLFAAELLYMVTILPADGFASPPKLIM